jgi:hypothetical protein
MIIVRFGHVAIPQFWKEKVANAAIVVTVALLMGAVATHTSRGKAFFLFYD